jgi:hypothetical protein
LVHPVPEERQDPVRNGDGTDTGSGLGCGDMEKLMFKVHVILRKVQKFHDPDTSIDEHEDQTDLRVFRSGPQVPDFIRGEGVPFDFVRVFIMVFFDVHELAVVLLADFIPHGETVKLTEKQLDVEQCGVVLPTAVYKAL